MPNFTVRRMYESVREEFEKVELLREVGLQDVTQVCSSYQQYWCYTATSSILRICYSRSFSKLYFIHFLGNRKSVES